MIDKPAVPEVEHLSNDDESSVSLGEAAGDSVAPAFAEDATESEEFLGRKTPGHPCRHFDNPGKGSSEFIAVGTR